ncbi:hypothetical protein KSB_86100 [Ktedonobacter robiniae]|uniref:AMP-binding enzyme C-terminal domain-containing protein n=1 Tax=Ktedonobacter robiniae TaxID=2778365 RepID=A0ABQ3V5F4_9CHLR|nr:AMP-binding protein [Ktedonobacter robiniae]GHO60135.1 hypothetical protein KSB_86100 [Ktedonobacter robiniae]
MPGEEGELIVEGPTVMVGYWGQPALQEARYATGDIVCLQEDGNYSYLGRRDHMVKIRGHRIELGAIEVALEAHPAIQEVVVLVQGQDVAARLVAFLVVGEQGGLSLLEVKRHCAERLPRYMIVDDISLMEALPRTRNGKVDRLSLAQQLASSTSQGEKR